MATRFCPTYGKGENYMIELLAYRQILLAQLEYYAHNIAKCEDIGTVPSYDYGCADGLQIAIEELDQLIAKAKS
jgi:hypothetical protein